MKVSEIMTKSVELLPPTATIQEAARKMQNDFGFIPVGENDKLIGAITDRDIVIRAVAEGKNNDTPIRDILSDKIQYCFENDDVETAAKKMQELQIRRLAVLNQDKRLVGVVSLGDLATHEHPHNLIGDTTERISESSKH